VASRRAEQAQRDATGQKQKNAATA